jgi:hypothetical protein
MILVCGSRLKIGFRRIRAFRVVELVTVARPKDADTVPHVAEQVGTPLLDALKAMDPCQDARPPQAL